jgi:cobalt-zinc-cadmium efflux system outer membrane protein
VREFGSPVAALVAAGVVSKARRQVLSSAVLLVCTLPLACSAPSSALRSPPESAPASPTALPERNGAASGAGAVQQAAFLAPAAAEADDTLRPPALLPPAAIPQQPPDLPFAGSSELSAESLVEQVLARSPTLPQMLAAWEAARARYPQVTSLDDPLFGTTLAPASLGVSGDGNTSGYRMEVFQRFPFPGKLELRGRKAQAEANTAGRDVDNTRVQLVESAREAFYDYFLAYRQKEVNDEGLDLLQRFRRDAADRYRVGKGPQQDIVQADVAIGQQRQRLLSLERARRVAIARIDTLLHLPPTSPLPPPPREISVPADLPDPQQMLAQALNQRLDLLALKDRIAAAEAAVKLALRDYYPDFDAMAAYDNFWTQGSLRPQVAVRINLPVRLARRAAAVEEAKARLAELHAQYAQQTDVVGYEVQQVYEQLRESYATVRLYEKEVLPKARTNVQSAEAAYVAGQIPLLTLVEAGRNLVNLRDQFYQTVTELFRRRTVLERALSGSPPAAPLPTPPRQPGPGEAGYPSSMGGMTGP